MCPELIGKLRKLVSGSGGPKTLSGLLAMYLKRYTGVRLVARPAGKRRTRSRVYRLSACPPEGSGEGDTVAS